jgi:hypothetical protein
MCNDFKNVIKKNLDINVTVCNKTDNVGMVSITGSKQIKSFLDWIYKDAKLKLNRKYQLYLDNYLNYKPFTGFSVKRIDKEGNEKIYINAQIAAKENNLKNSGGISMVCYGKRKTAGGFKWEFVK